MTALFAIPLLIGFAGLLAWIVATALDTGDGGPETRFGQRGRAVVAALLGFGLAGIGALYAGWPEWSAILAGIVGACALVAASLLLRPESS